MVILNQANNRLSFESIIRSAIAALILFAILATMTACNAPQEKTKRVHPLSEPLASNYIPIFRPPPLYPRRALQQRRCGYVDLSYTVTAAGIVIDPIVTASSSRVFELSAKNAVLRYKYKPRLVGGKPAAVAGVETRVLFQIEGVC